MSLPIRLAARFIQQKTGQEKVICKKCGSPITFKWIGNKGDHTYKCKCGIDIFKNKEKNKFHDYFYSIRSFHSARDYIPNYKELDLIEKDGRFKKKFNKNGKKVYSND